MGRPFPGSCVWDLGAPSQLFFLYTSPFWEAAIFFWEEIRISGLHFVTCLLFQRKTWCSELANFSRHPTRALEKVIILCHWGRYLFLWRFLLPSRSDVLNGFVFLAAVIYVLWAVSLNHASKRDRLFYREIHKVIYASGVTCFKAVH